ncbi:hypothetical protein GCM10023322_13960 [Rugosimonospora acidiphila]|uniref:Uncharacterized protein n=1 Tax=Rugosimonospora acidiphila TaxID=556531 RepID=A0ABP9RP26_9ACTN
MPNETSSITIALVLLMWALGVLAFLGTLIWSRAHPGELRRWAHRHSGQVEPAVARRAATARVPVGGRGRGA